MMIKIYGIRLEISRIANDYLLKARLEVDALA